MSAPRSSLPTTADVVIIGAGLAGLACLIAVYTQAHGHATGVYLAVLVAGAVLVWPTGAPTEPHLLPVIWPLIDQTRGDPLAPFAMDRQKRYVVSADATAAVAYRVRAGFAVVSGDPVGDRRAYPDAIDAFAQLCRDRGWRPLVLAASPRCAVLWRRRRVCGRPWWVVPIGHDAVVEVATFTLHGRGKRNLRQAVQRTHNARMTTTVLPEADITAALHDELLAVAHGSTKSIDAERGFSMMLDGTLTSRYPGTWLIVARDQHRRGAGIPALRHRRRRFLGEPGSALAAFRRAQRHRRTAHRRHDRPREEPWGTAPVTVLRAAHRHLRHRPRRPRTRRMPDG